MENHVLAVWDFMSLLKSLQARLTSVSSPWRPVGSPNIRRFVNEIVLGEESDVDAEGRFVSHFEMYLAAMHEVGADTRPVEQLIERLEEGESVEDALIDSPIPAPARVFVRHTFDVINSGSLPAIVATFTFGREDLIPEMFQAALDSIGAGDNRFAPQFRYYLQRHIEVDGDSHSGLARQLVEEICRTPSDWQIARQAAARSLQARRELWDGVLAGLPRS
jgi:hypothetical protein